MLKRSLKEKLAEAETFDECIALHESARFSSRRSANKILGKAFERTDSIVQAAVLWGLLPRDMRLEARAFKRGLELSTTPELCSLFMSRLEMETSASLLVSYPDEHERIQQKTDRLKKAASA